MKDKYTFGECSLVIMDEVFGLRETFQSQVLNNWLNMAIPISEEEAIMLKTIQKVLHANRNAWNEHELSLHFIGPMFSLVNFTEVYRFNLFSQRHISAKIPTQNGDITLGGEPDGIIATGYRAPKIPMFAFTEYKRQHNSDGDPVGQTLAAALVGQVLNKEPIPIYGCYVIGDRWTFLVLDGKHYTTGTSCSAIEDDILDIFRILKALKSIIMDLTA
ncbi:MAG: hypothetical protein AAF639_41555 [Chloroflexota bacterium]